MEMYRDAATQEEKRPLTQDDTPTHIPTQMMVTPAVSKINTFFICCYDSFFTVGIYIFYRWTYHYIYMAMYTFDYVCVLSILMNKFILK